MIWIWQLLAATQVKGTAQEKAPARDCRETKKGYRKEGAWQAEINQGKEGKQ